MKKLFLILIFPLYAFGQSFTKEEITHWQQQAKRVTIIRDNWGVPHIYGKTDADAVFGLMYAQAEDDFWSLENTIIINLGRQAEIHGSEKLVDDLLVQLYESIPKTKRVYASLPNYYKRLCEAYANGLNYYIYNNPGKVRLIKHYEPWFALLQDPTDLNNEIISKEDILSFYTKNQQTTKVSLYKNQLTPDVKGSNAWSLAPSRTTSGNAFLFINPHGGLIGDGVRSEVHVNSEEGLHVYGTAFFGSLLVWHGFNEFCGWAKTVNATDLKDLYTETFDHPTDRLAYRYGKTYRKAITWFCTIKVKNETGIGEKKFKLIKTHHGPLVAHKENKLLSSRNAFFEEKQLRNSFLQIWNMAKSKSRKEFHQNMLLCEMSGILMGVGNTTTYADKQSNIAYYHTNYCPKRLTKFDWVLPVDGTNPETEWKGFHTMNEMPVIINPTTGFTQNGNSSAFIVAGASSPDSANFPIYMANDPITWRAKKSLRLLDNNKKYSFKEFMDATHEPSLPRFENLIPGILQAYDLLTNADTLKSFLKEPIDTIRHWDMKTSIHSTATNLAILWIEKLSQISIRKGPPLYYNKAIIEFAASYDCSLFTQQQVLEMFSNVIKDLQKSFGTWKVAWGEINRLQRIHPSGYLEKFSDDNPSLPIDATDGDYGSLFAYRSRNQPGQKRRYSTFGSTFIACIEFGKRINAYTVMGFGQSADPSSKHYFDQAPLYASHQFKQAWFYKEDVLKNAEREYHPGE